MLGFWVENPIIRTDVIADMIGDTIFEEFNHLMPCKLHFEVPEKPDPILFIWDGTHM